MKTLSVKVPARLAARLEHTAKRRRVSKSELIRQLLSHGLASDLDESLTAFQLMRNGIGVVESGIGNLATGDEHMEGFGT